MDLIWGQAQLRRAAAHWHDGQITPRGEIRVKGLSRACCHSPRKRVALVADGGGSWLLTVLGHDLFAGPAEPGTVLLQAGQHHRITVIHHRTAEARNIARAGIVPLPLRRRAGGDQEKRQDKRNNEKKSEHRVMPTDHDVSAF